MSKRPASETRRLSGAVLACLFAMAPLDARAQSASDGLTPQPAPDEPALIPVEIRESFAEHLVRLNDQSWAARVEAARWLKDARVSDQVFEILSRAEYLSLEQKHQVVAILRDRILERRAGAIGIQMRPARFDDGPGVVVMSILARMPAEEVLRPGDRITHVNGEPLSSYDASDEFSRLIATHRPGDRVTLRIVRPRNPDGLPDEGTGLNAAQTVMDVDVTLAEDQTLGEATLQNRQLDRETRARIAVMELSPAAVPLRVPRADASVDQHGAIIELKRLLARAAGGEDVSGRVAILREQVRTATTQLGLSPDEQRHRFEVYQRFIELLSGDS